MRRGWIGLTGDISEPAESRLEGTACNAKKGWRGSPSRARKGGRELCNVSSYLPPGLRGISSGLQCSWLCNLCSLLIGNAGMLSFFAGAPSATRSWLALLPRSLFFFASKVVHDAST